MAGVVARMCVSQQQFTGFAVLAPQVAYRIGRTMFETASLPQHLVQHCNAMEEVWVPSEFNRDTFISAGMLDQGCTERVLGATSERFYA